MTKIIAVCGPPGSGKSTLCSKIVKLLPASIYISMDRYQLMTEWDEFRLDLWCNHGCDYNELPVPGLLERLESLKNGQPLIGGNSSPSLDYIILESHIGRCSTAMKKIIDFVFWLDLDFDLCLARALLAMTEGQKRYENYSTMISVDELDGYLSSYLSRTAKLLRIQRDRIKPDADLIISNPSAQTIINWIQTHT
jgi:uridine kinase